ncbi:hypothetical protein DL95DRAFT_461389 [Leptodontidium sp. 2 PMI_412]|nr:hypothetical protein DL95DRAFT_461389 [Leptodontidium sp. 2 PMI_412]
MAIMLRPGPVDNFSTIQLQVTPDARREFRDREANQQFHESVRPLEPYYPTIDLGRNSVSPSSRPQTFQPHIADRSKFPNPTKKELLEPEKLELEKLVSMHGGYARQPDPTYFHFRTTYRHQAHDPRRARRTKTSRRPRCSSQHSPRGAYSFKLYYKPVNTTVPLILQICRESPSYGLTKYKSAFKNVDQDGNVEDQIYVNPKLDTITIELPIEIMRYPRVKPFPSKPSP